MILPHLQILKCCLSNSLTSELIISDWKHDIKVNGIHLAFGCNYLTLSSSCDNISA